MSTTELKGPIWPIESQHEVLLKQVYAYLFQSWGYKIDMKSTEIHNEKNFVASKANTIGAIAKEPPIEEETKVAYANLRKKMKFLKNSEGHIMSPELAKYAETSPKVSQDLHKSIAHHPEADSHYLFMSEQRNIFADNCIKKFTVARKWKLDDAMEMLVKKYHWKTKVHPTPVYVDEGDADIYFKGKHKEFIHAFELDKVHMRGKDKEKRPIVVIRVKKHFRHDCPDEDFERFICLIIEWVSLATKPHQDGVDKGSILFDMTGFSLKNADLAAVKFLAGAFEANYPECLGAVWIHNAPWIFNTVWKIIKGWLDPVVASKIHFTKSVGELEKFVDRKYIPKSIGGDDTFATDYIKPTHEADDRTPKDENFDKIVAERDILMLEFLQATISWIHSKSPVESYELLQLRIKLQVGLAKNYLQLDPYIRTRGFYERNGQMGPLGY